MYSAVQFLQYGLINFLSSYSNDSARYSTTAPLAETEALTATLSNQIEQNTSRLHNTAVNAAKSAEVS